MSRKKPAEKRRAAKRPALRRMEAATLTPEETERVGLALMRLEETIRDLCRQFAIDPPSSTSTSARSGP